MNNNMKNIKVYQTGNEADFTRNTFAGLTGEDFVPVMKMQLVLMYRKPARYTDEELLDEIFQELNEDSSPYRSSLNYSLSVGDACRIDNKFYRCLAHGWELMM